MENGATENTTTAAAQPAKQAAKPVNKSQPKKAKKAKKAKKQERAEKRQAQQGHNNTGENDADNNDDNNDNNNDNDDNNNADNNSGAQATTDVQAPAPIDPAQDSTAHESSNNNNNNNNDSSSSSNNINHSNHSDESDPNDTTNAGQINTSAASTTAQAQVPPSPIAPTLASKPLSSWSSQDCADVVCSLGKAFAAYHSVFVDNGVTGKVLLSMSEDDLKELGINTGVHRKAILDLTGKLTLKATRSPESEDLDLAVEDESEFLQDVDAFLDSVDRTPSKGAAAANDDLVPSTPHGETDFSKMVPVNIAVAQIDGTSPQPRQKKHRPANKSAANTPTPPPPGFVDAPQTQQPADETAAASSSTHKRARHENDTQANNRHTKRHEVTSPKHAPQSDTLAQDAASAFAEVEGTMTLAISNAKSRPQSGADSTAPNAADPATPAAPEPTAAEPTTNDTKDKSKAKGKGKNKGKKDNTTATNNEDTTQPKPDATTSKPATAETSTKPAPQANKPAAENADNAENADDADNADAAAAAKSSNRKRRAKGKKGDSKASGADATVAVETSNQQAAPAKAQKPTNSTEGTVAATTTPPPPTRRPSNERTKVVKVTSNLKLRITSRSAVKTITENTGCRIIVPRARPNTNTAQPAPASEAFVLAGTQEQIDSAHQLIEQWIDNQTEVVVPVPEHVLVAVVGRPGQRKNLNEIERVSGAALSVQLTSKDARGSQQVVIRGSHPAVVLAQQLLERDINGWNKSCLSIEVPKAHVGFILGKSGAKLKPLRELEGIHGITVVDSRTGNENFSEFVICGTREAMDKARVALEDFASAAVTSMPVVVEMPLQKSELGLVIGKKGATVQQIQSESNTRISLKQSPPRVLIEGSQAQISKARELIEAALKQGDGRDGVVKERVVVPANLLGRIIGKGGQTIRDIRAKTGAEINVSPVNTRSKHDTGSWVEVSGSDDERAKAKAMIEKLVVAPTDQPRENQQRQPRQQRQIPSGESRRFQIPSDMVGTLIGRGGSRIKELEQSTNCRIMLPKRDDVDEQGQVEVTVIGQTADEADDGLKKIQAVLAALQYDSL